MDAAIDVDVDISDFGTKFNPISDTMYSAPSSV
jgi:hypothetical protein